MDVKLGINNVKCLYLVQRSQHQFTLFLKVCNSENPKSYEIWLLYSEKTNKYVFIL